jgi:hypothetical protein
VSLPRHDADFAPTRSRSPQAVGDPRRQAEIAAHFAVRVLELIAVLPDIDAAAVIE